MKICIYGAASDKIDKEFIKLGESLGKTLAERGHSLVYGAGSSGMMGAAARGFHQGNGYVHGIIPKFFEEGGYEAIYYKADKITYVEDMADRKEMMEDTCDAFIICPGGIGTFDEFFQVLTLKQLGRHQKAIVVYNMNGYYDDMLAMMEKAIKMGFINEECEKIYVDFDNEKQVVDYLESYDESDVNWSRLKRTNDQ